MNFYDRSKFHGRQDAVVINVAITNRHS